MRAGRVATVMIPLPIILFAGDCDDNLKGILQTCDSSRRQGCLFVPSSRVLVPIARGVSDFRISVDGVSYVAL